MLDLYDRVKIKKSGLPGNIVDIMNNNRKGTPVYYVEVDDEYKAGNILEDIIWCESDEIELIEKF